MKIETFDQLNEVIEALNDIIIEGAESIEDYTLSLTNQDITLDYITKAVVWERTRASLSHVVGSLRKYSTAKFGR